MRILVFCDAIMKFVKFAFIFVVMICIHQDVAASRIQHIAPQLLVNANGDSVTIWRCSKKNEKYCVQASQKLKQRWSTAHDVSDDVSYLGNVQAQMDESGTVLVTWTQINHQTQQFQVYSNTFKSGRWGKPTVVSGLNERVEGCVSSAINNGHSEILWNSYKDDDLLIHFSDEAAQP
jgi:hypothetical protein